MDKRKTVYKPNPKKPDTIRPAVCAHAQMQEGVEAFLAEIKRRKQSPLTIGKRRYDLRLFTAFLEERDIRRFQDVTRRTLDQFRLWLMDQGYSEAIQESTTRAAQLLLRFLAARGDLFEDPAAHLKIPKAPMKFGTVLSISEMRRLLRGPDLTTPEGIRDRAMIEILYATAMRRGELFGLKVFDVDLDRATVRVCGKNGKERLLPLGRQAVQYLRLYLTDSRPRFQPRLSTQYEELWLSCLRKPVTYAMINVMIRGYAAAAGLNKPTDPHTIRRTCATHLLLGGAHPVAVAQLLGHADLTSLGHYLRTTVGDLKRAHAQTKPGQ